MVAFWNRNNFAQNIVFDAGLEREPLQVPAKVAPFTAEFSGVSYRVEPQYDYDLYGLVVSYRHHDGNSMLHKSWNDHLNMVDVCVVWQDSAFSPHLNKLEFWNGQFTCNVKTQDDDAWAQLKLDQLSNNHLISDDPVIREQVSDIKIGDQVHIRGWLSAYSNSAQSGNGGGGRGTSTVRTDTGNGACETIYVNEFRIVRATNRGWRKLMYLSLIIFVSAQVVYFRSPHIGRGKR